MNDIKFLDFQKLGKDYQAAYKTLRDEMQNTPQIQEYVASLGDPRVTATAPPLQPLQELRCRELARSCTVEAWAIQNRISQKLSWLPHQLLAYFGTWTAVRQGDLYSAPLTWEANTRERGDYYALGAGILATSSRANFFKDAPRGSQQYRSPIAPLVPIILAGFKKYQNIGYTQWHPSGLDVLLDPELSKLLGCEAPPVSQSELIALRNTAITDQSGARAGIPNNPATCTKLNHLGTSAIAHLPKLAKYMMLQTWCAHPSNRSPYMILDPNNWDGMPEPLVSRDIFQHQQAVDVHAHITDLAW